MPRPARTNTAEEILEVASRLVQTRGFNGFSYADVAVEIGTTPAALHYHFATKADLGLALVQRYVSGFRGALDEIRTSLPDGRTRLDAYRDLYLDVLARRRLCLCGMLAAEIATLTEPMRAGIVGFFDDNVAWLEQTIADGNADGSIRAKRGPRETAEAIVGGFEGAMLLAWSHDDPARFRRAADHLLALLTGDPGGK
jgi:TetR/AcrR family transcriptional repressor of nem operon